MSSGPEGSPRVMLFSSDPLSRGIEPKAGNSSPKNSAVSGIGSRTTAWPRPWLAVNFFCVWSGQAMWCFLHARKDPEVVRGVVIRFRFPSTTRAPLRSLCARLDASRSEWCAAPPGSLSIKASSRPIITWVTARPWVNISNISLFIRIVLWPAWAGERLPGRWPAGIISSDGVPPTEIETSRLSSRTPVSLFCRRLFHDTSPHYSIDFIRKVLTEFHTVDIGSFGFPYSLFPLQHASLHPFQVLLMVLPTAHKEQSVCLKEFAFLLAL